MKIVYISKYAVLPDFGAPTRQYFLSKYMAAKGHDILLIGSRSIPEKVPEFKGLYRSVKKENLEMVTLQGPPVTLGFSMKRIWSWIVFEWNLFRYFKNIKKFNPDVVLVSSLSILTFIYGVYLKRKLKVPLVLEVRDIYPLTLYEVGGYSKNHPFVKMLGWIERYGYKNADLILSTLPNAVEHIESVVKRKVNFGFIPMGIDTDYFNINVNDPTPEFVGMPGSFRICYAGTIGLSNALDTMFEAATEFESEQPEIKFVLIGDGPLKNMYRDKYGQLKNVEFYDPVPKKDLQNYLSQMDILIHTYFNKPIYKFGVSPNKWIDYMLSSRPVLVALNGKKPIVYEAGCGIFVQPEDKEALKAGILELYRKPANELTEMGKKGRSYLLNNLTYPELTNKLLALLKQVSKNTNT